MQLKFDSRIDVVGHVPSPYLIFDGAGQSVSTATVLVMKFVHLGVRACGTSPTTRGCVTFTHTSGTSGRMQYPASRSWLRQNSGGTISNRLEDGHLAQIGSSPSKAF